jgi:hypothetical protein
VLNDGVANLPKLQEYEKKEDVSTKEPRMTYLVILKIVSELV